MIVIKAESISKKYTLGAIGTGSFQRDFQSWWAKIRKKEDPNEIILEDHEYRPETSREQNSTFWALQNINMEIEKGDRVGIIGRNGAGKSTFLKLLSRITAPTLGEIKVRGRITSLLEVGTGFHPELSGRENIYLNGAILGMSKNETKSKIEEIIDFAEIGQFIDTPVKRYSSGMYVRLAFSVAVHLQSEILILDEILAVGDTKFQKKCMQKISEVGGQGRTILFVSHNLNSILVLCNKVAHLRAGKLVEFGETQLVVNNYLDSLADSQLESIIRSFDGNLIIKRVRFMDSKEKIQNIFPMLSDLCVEISYEALADLGTITFSVGVSGASGSLFMGSMLYDASRPNIKKGSGTLRCIFKKMPLMPGQMYSVFLAIRGIDYETPLTGTIDVGSFAVEGDLASIRYDGPLAKQTAKVSGPIIMDYKWEHAR
ncbi:ABC transporter ATP-binding protein [Leptospira fletcheri]|uniref:ABC transporter ATP-binding protein n=1 Tax=Leptospira fletcheri TaxID=2484981 RepID=A0A4R9GEN6_9LEPT|nr:ABC transporter ATP-binding protein [Leptospira fletcheri]TGK09955.1 ABC transporter ATP-binding protein [Leptospira fletcheri]